MVWFGDIFPLNSPHNECINIFFLLFILNILDFFISFQTIYPKIVFAAFDFHSSAISNTLDFLNSNFIHKIIIVVSFI